MAGELSLSMEATEVALLSRAVKRAEGNRAPRRGRGPTEEN